MSEVVSVSSVSGGASSAFMAVHYPTDYYIFACVGINHLPSAPKDSGLLRKCKAKLPKFVACQEQDQTLKLIFDLEEKIGKEIIWVSADYFMEDFILKNTDLPGYRGTGRFQLPSKFRRFCTAELKVKPIKHFLYSHVYKNNFPILQYIGFRADEPKRVEKWTCENDKEKIPISCKIKNKRYQYTNVELTNTTFPMYHDSVTKQQVNNYWRSQGWEFPIINDCRFCFFKSDLNLQRQAKREPGNLLWWLEMEEKTKLTFKDRPLQQIIDEPYLEKLFPEDNNHCLCGN